MTEHVSMSYFKLPYENDNENNVPVQFPRGSPVTGDVSTAVLPRAHRHVLSYNLSTFPFVRHLENNLVLKFKTCFSVN